VMKAALKMLFALALIAMASAPRLSGAPAMNGAAVQVLACSVSSDPSPADFSVPAGAIPLGLAMADFTGDSHPDLATLELDRLDSSRAYYVIEIRLTEGGRQSLRLTAPARSLVLTPMDVRGDGILDLVVHSVGSRVPVAVFVNDGCGHFSANKSARYATAIHEIPGGAPDFCASHLSFESAALVRGPHAAEFQGQPRCFLQEINGPHFSGYEGAPAELFLPLGTNRAPPAIE
jgi:hypothetical protein